MSPKNTNRLENTDRPETSDQSKFLYEPVERFGVKAGVDELEGQPIEEFGMRGGRALSAKVVFGFDQALAEVAVPDTVDGDAHVVDLEPQLRLPAARADGLADGVPRL